MGPSGVVGLDYMAVFAVGDASGVERSDLMDVLPHFEQCLIIYYSGDDQDGGEEDID